jgi:DNA-damage-inducible protein D
MTGSDKYEKKFGLDIPFEEALARFGQVTKEELQAVDADGSPIELVEEGETAVVPFKGVQVRKILHNGEWWFSIIDVIEALSDTTNAARYWSDLKRQMTDKEGFSEVYEEIVKLKMPGADGKLYPTDAANPETVFRIIQSIPSPKAEAFKRWLAKVAFERIEEIQNPEIAIKRAIMEYQLQGRPMEWIEQRVRSILVRKELTNEWKKRGVDEKSEYAILTQVLSTRTFGVGPAEHRVVKGLKRHHQLRDHMTDLELILTQLGEKSTKEIAQIRNAQGFNQNKEAARLGGDIAGTARRSLEKETGRPVVSKTNFLPKKPPELA